MEGEGRERVDHLNGADKNLIGIWNKPRIIYEQNLEAQKFKHDTQQLDRWLASKEDVISDPNLGELMAVVEEHRQ